MRLNSPSEIELVAQKNNFSIFELPTDIDFSQFFGKSYHVAPDGPSNEIKIDQIREITRIASNQQSDDLYIVFEQAERINEKAANAFLKSLEEPSERVHYIFLTHNASQILPTIKSRANNYYIKTDQRVSDAPAADVEIFKLAKSYVSAAPTELPGIVDKIIKYKKDESRKIALNVVACGIDLMYKSYLLRGNSSFLQKLEKLIKTQDALSQNGHVKLQLIANML